MQQNPSQINTFWTTSLDLAACLVALHFKMRAGDPITRVIRSQGDKETCTFYFESTAANPDFGTLVASEVMRAWRAEEVCEMRKKNPAAYSLIDYLRTAFQNRSLLIDAIKTKVTPMGAHEVNGHTAFLPLNASPALQAKMKRMISDS